MLHCQSTVRAAALCQSEGVLLKNLGPSLKRRGLRCREKVSGRGGDGITFTTRMLADAFIQSSKNNGSAAPPPSGLDPLHPGAPPAAPLQRHHLLPALLLSTAPHRLLPRAAGPLPPHHAPAAGCPSTCRTTTTSRSASSTASCPSSWTSTPSGAAPVRSWGPGWRKPSANRRVALPWRRWTSTTTQTWP
ncbi:unnamed protein product [Gadus morhua 'NCC']